MKKDIELLNLNPTDSLPGLFMEVQNKINEIIVELNKTTVLKFTPGHNMTININTEEEN